ncbi:hypothetical protein PIB30_103019, partial [Stylosanthes scabra]|nr:hypothetical protein [Stylosanthes scabra]
SSNSTNMGCREVQRVVSVPSSPSLERNRKPMKPAPSIAARNTSTQMYYHFNHFAHQLVSATRSGDSAHLRDSPNSSSALLTRPLSGCLVVHKFIALILIQLMSSVT